ncbi:MAG: hypothetical protein Q8M02_10500 [Candidatus Didemnitutus sp.]|nr:hypothetical protein [Candidatus Didemnitutus sp.]
MSGACAIFRAPDPRPASRSEADALADFHAPLVDSVDAQIAAGRGVAAPWPTRTLLRRMERMSVSARAEFIRAVEKLAETFAP